MTGDVAFSAQPAEYEAARKWLETLCTTLGIAPTQVLVVPGNHDVNQAKVSGNFASETVRDGLRANPRRLDDLLKLENVTQLQATLWPKLEDFASFAQHFGPSSITPSSPFWSNALSCGFPGVHAVGLNTSLLSYDEDDAPDNLALGSGQLQRVFDIDGLPEGSLVLALLHHPPEWLIEGPRLLRMLENRAHILFCGHLHHQSGQITHSLFRDGTIRLEAGAAQAGRNEAQSHAYAWGRLSHAGLEFYPRSWNPERECFQAERNRFQTDAQDRLFTKAVKLPQALKTWLQTDPPPPPPPNQATVWKCHRQYLVEKHQTIPLHGIRKRGEAARIELSDVYVELSARGHDSTQPNPESQDREPTHGRETKLRIHQALARSPRAIVIGDPGSGKTTLLRFAARVIAEGWLKPSTHAAAARKLLGLPADQALPIPLFTTLASLDRFLDGLELPASAVNVGHGLLRRTGTDRRPGGSPLASTRSEDLEAPQSPPHRLNDHHGTCPDRSSPRLTLEPPAATLASAACGRNPADRRRHPNGGNGMSATASLASQRWQVEYPESDGKPMAETDVHRRS